MDATEASSSGTAAEKKEEGERSLKAEKMEVWRTSRTVRYLNDEMHERSLLSLFCTSV